MRSPTMFCLVFGISSLTGCATEPDLGSESSSISYEGQVETGEVGEISSSPDQATEYVRGIQATGHMVLAQSVDANLLAVSNDVFGTLVIPDVTSPGFNRQCRVESIAITGGRCFVQTCPRALRPPSPLSAGTARILGGRFTVTIRPAADGTYPVVERVDDNLWNGGERLAFSFQGKPSAPAVLPASASLKAPPKDVRMTSTVPRRVGPVLNVAWTGGAGATGSN
ncbi:MAG: hypothetical protein ACREA0_29675, partial [bacterium]